MGLLSNGYRHTLTGRMFGATALDGGNPSVLRSRLKPAYQRNLLLGISDNKSAVPNGNLPQSAWIMPNKGGGMSSRSADITIATSGGGTMGFPIEGNTSFSITTNTPDGQLIVSGTGSTTFEISTNNPLLTASINGGGTASFVIETNIPILGAEASLIGETTITISTNTPSMLPTDTTSPLRTATASFEFNGTLTRYAVGHMDGTTDVSDTVTNSSVARAVWDELLIEHQSDGSAGKALGTASSGGVDLNLMAQAVWEYVSRTLTSGGGGATPEQIAAATLAAATAAGGIDANMTHTNGTGLKGDGTDGNKFRSVLVA